MKILDNIGLGHLYDKLKDVFLRNGYGVTWDKTTGNVEVKSQKDIALGSKVPSVTCTDDAVIISQAIAGLKVTFAKTTTFDTPVTFTQDIGFDGSCDFVYAAYFNSGAEFYGDVSFNDGVTICTLDVTNNATFSDTVQFQKTATFDGGMNINSCAINTINGIRLSLTSSDNEMCISGGNDRELIFNYRKAHNGHAPKVFTWRDGTSSGYATHQMGELRLMDSNSNAVSLSATQLKKLLALV